MENSDTPKTRRPLPTPGASGSQRPTTPVTAMTNASPVPPATFYGKPPLPSRSRNHGSNHTAYLAPPQEASRHDPPSYQQDSPSFREPELVVDEPYEDDQPPELLPAEYMSWGDSSTQAQPWTSTTDLSAWETQPTSSWNNVPNTEFPIEGRSKTEEASWWNTEDRKRYNRPGQGILAPVLAEELHDPNHSLFHVNIAPPAWAQVPPPSTPAPSPARPSASPPVDPTASPPTEEELRAAVPHPNAYYCPKDNGWVILSWKSSAVTPPLARSYLQGRNPPLPDQVRRKRNHSCIEDGDQPYGKTNKTHHFHFYEKAVDSLKLTPPFRQDEWQLMEDLKQRRRAAYMRSDIDVSTIKDGHDSIVDDDEISDEGKLLDLYVCCQCSFFIVASGVISGVIPRKVMDELVRDKRQYPAAGRTPEQSVVLALETLQTAIENKLWKGNSRMIKVASTGFQTKLGWNPNVKRIFEQLGFVVEDSPDGTTTLRPPVTDLVAGKANRRKLLRAWVEIGSWLADFRRIHAPQFKEWKENKAYVQLDSAREIYQTAVGAHPDQIPRGVLSDGLLQALRPLHSAWKGLGLTPTTYAADLLAFAYLAQCRCDPAGTPKYFTYMTEIIKTMQEYGSCPSELQDLLAMEQSRDRFTLQDVATAATTLGFGSDNLLKVDYDKEVPDDFVESAWKDCIKRSWRDPQYGSESHRLANEAFRILAEYRGSVPLRRVWESSKNIVMNPDRAYETIEIPKDMDDGMVITVYNMRLEETPSQASKMRDSLMVIAEVRDSERLRQFIATGQDPGDIQAATPPELPRGLNQLGNTCYLNSLLQYFYTIKDLREAVLPMSKMDLKVLEEEKLSDEDLKRHRVGGRLVTRREIIRSRKFVNQLAALFNHLEYSETAAVTPTIELAKLALITSRDEEEDEVDKGGTDSSHDTEATLVEDGPARPSGSPQSPDRTSTVLGKRSRDLDRQRSEMEVDSPISGSPKEKDGFVFVPSNPDSSSSKQVEPSSSKSRLVDNDGDIRMQSPEKPPLPPRRRTAPSSDSTMMFGKQHDVAECMDNCMFQIETALLRFDNYDSADKTSVVKRLFYGKIRQRLTGIELQNSRASIHEKEDLFSHLPVNVINDGVDIYDGLSGYFDDVVDFEGKKVRMEMSLVDLPPILQIQLQRVQFNRETLQPYKSQAYVKFGENLFMDRFMDNADPAKKAKSKAIQHELNATRDRLRLLVEGKDTPFATSIDYTRSYLQTMQKSVPGIDTDLLQRLTKEKTRIHDEIDHLRAHAESLKDMLEHTWRDSTEVAYELTSVFIHRGSSPSFGHYFFYSRHLPGSPDSWFKYNDSDVTVVSKEEVLADTTGSTANPYLLVFARKGADLVDTVKRFDPTLLDSP